MARPEKKMSVHFDESIMVKANDVEDAVQLKDVSSSTRKLSYSNRISQVVLRRKKSHISETTIIVSAIVFTIVFILGIVGWLVFSENSSMRMSRVPDYAHPDRPYGRQ